MMPVCPKCDVALILLEFNGVQVDYCPKCEGLWLDRGEIEELLERTGAQRFDPLVNFFAAPSRRETGRPAYLCPRCDRALKEVARRGADGHELRLDRCPRGDGIWFDKNELHLLLHALPDEIEAQGAIAVLSEVLGKIMWMTSTKETSNDGNDGRDNRTAGDCSNRSSLYPVGNRDLQFTHQDPK